MENKKVVHYYGAPLNLYIGRRALVEVVDHPDLAKGEIADTSPVVAIDEDTGAFETLNTVYKPCRMILG